jgi:hypothetical protein
MKIFVFGSNLAGKHGAGAARAARLEHGARWGVGEGLTGNAYAIPTKDELLRPRRLRDIRASVERFVAFARARADLEFQVTRVGCGYAGYDDKDIAPMFAGAPDNCELPTGWR